MNSSNHLDISSASKSETEGTKKGTSLSGDNVLEQSHEKSLEKRQMELNRMRAREIRKRKKEREEDMQQQIIQLVLENDKLRTQLKIQEKEISILRTRVSSNDIKCVCSESAQYAVRLNLLHHLFPLANEWLNV